MMQQQTAQLAGQAAAKNGMSKARIQILETLLQQRNNNESVVLCMAALSAMNTTQNSNSIEQIQVMVKQMQSACSVATPPVTLGNAVSAAAGQQFGELTDGT